MARREIYCPQSATTSEALRTRYVECFFACCNITKYLDQYLSNLVIRCSGGELQTREAGAAQTVVHIFHRATRLEYSRFARKAQQRAFNF